MNKSELRCPACLSKIKQRVGDIISTDPTSITKMSTKPLKRAKASFETKCPKCSSLIYINVFWEK